MRYRQTQLASRGTTRHRRVMWSWRILGLISFAFGAIGLFLPIWPTTVFWIVAALAFARSNPAWAEWIYARPKIGPPIRTFVETGALSHAPLTTCMAIPNKLKRWTTKKTDPVLVCHV